MVVCTFLVFDDHCKLLQEGNPIEMMSLVHLGVDLNELKCLLYQRIIISCPNNLSY